MEQHTVLRLVTIALAAYGVYHAFYAIAMLPVLVSPLLLLAFALQPVLAILAAVGVWRAQRWAAAVLLLLSPPTGKPSCCCSAPATARS